MKKKYCLTPEHRDQLKPWADKWIENALSCKPMDAVDRKAMVAAIRGLYQAADLPEPLNIVFVPSPLVARIASGFAAAIWYLATNDATYDATDVATNVATDFATRDATDDATRVATDFATRDATNDATDVATRDATDVATRDATYDATGDATGVATRVATYDATDVATNVATDFATRDATNDATRDATDVATRDATNDATDVATDNATRDATDVATRDATYDATRDATNDATRDATRDATDVATRDATRVATGVATDVATRDATNDATDDATYVATYVATDVATNDATDVATRDATRDATDVATDVATDFATRVATDVAIDVATRDATYDATDTRRWARTLAKKLCPQNYELLCACARNAWKMANGGNHHSSRVAFLSFFRHVAKLELPIYEKWQHYENAAIHGSWRYMHPKFCIVSDRPEVLKTDEANRPHCEDGPSHRWRDGWELHHWHGVRVPKEWIENKKFLTPEIALNQTNAELRRTACEIIGWDKVLESDGLNYTILNEDLPHIGTLVQVDLPGAPGQWFIKYQCGTGRIFAEPVNDKSYDTALKANAGGNGWRPGMGDPEDFIPFIRT